MKLLNQTARFAALLCLLALMPLSLLSQNAFTVGEVSTTPGEKKSGYIHVPGGADDGPVKVPITVVNGVKDGPVLALVAGVHGYEYPPVLAMTILSK